MFVCVGGEGPPLSSDVLTESVHCNDMIELAPRHEVRHGTYVSKGRPTLRVIEVRSAFVARSSVEYVPLYVELKGKRYQNKDVCLLFFVFCALDDALPARSLPRSVASFDWIGFICARVSLLERYYDSATARGFWDRIFRSQFALVSFSP